MENHKIPSVELGRARMVGFQSYILKCPYPFTRE
jgi:hypothetical protein